ncbi:hypothetical protein K4K49_011668 [Colletotrichum sp. SAR 10_70]|nr:hypothetical protein K4K50_011894 [Colletotrichum sp. SAR 10_71]KAI8151059.1 hypothetical protein K4K49_011668 [Colletotrichum sp. SAR 10_70]KAI8151807.1 hypothetical protein KHU50_011931 [Colletotrichum sp. SAR 10_65]KAI8218580.1 hypothetical protein K4K54_010262 [Colletotrichum sp. SAR 10_86]
MSLLRLTLTRSSAPTTHFLPALRSCPLRPQLLRKSLPPQSLRRPFASSAPPPRSHGSGTAATTPTASKPAATSPGSTAQLLPERLLVYQAGTGRIGFVAGLKITTIFVAAVFALVWEPAMLRSDDVSVAQITAACKSPPPSLPLITPAFSLAVSTPISSPYTPANCQTHSYKRTSRLTP